MALNFGGSDDVNHGNIDGIDGASAFTAVVWVNPDNLDANRRVVFAKGASGTSVDLIVGGLFAPNSGKVGLSVNSGNGADSQNTNPVLNRVWTHLAYVFDGNGAGNSDRLKLYVNGLPHTLTYTGTIPATLPGGGSVVKVQQNYDAVFAGKIAHLKMWTAALSAGEILREKRWREPQRKSGLILWAPYDRMAGDYSDRNNHGVVSGATVTRTPGPNIYFTKRWLRSRGLKFNVGQFMPFMHPSLTS